MWRQCMLLLVVAVVAAAANDEDIMRDDERHCDRLRSRAVRDIIKKHVLPIAEEHGVDMSPSCILHPSRDMTATHELKKKYYRPNLWKCEVCSKQFKAEEYIDRHMYNRHLEMVPPQADICLGSLCNMFNCEGHTKVKSAVATRERTQKRALEKAGKRTPKHKRAKTGCDPSTMERERLRCLRTFEQCFPHKVHAATDKHHYVSELFSLEYCRRLSCDKSAQSEESLLPEIAMPTGRKVYYILLAFFLVICAAFYVGVWLYRRDMSISSDLRRLTARRHSDRLAFWRKPKLKGY